MEQPKTICTKCGQGTTTGCTCPTFTSEVNAVYQTPCGNPKLSLIGGVAITIFCEKPFGHEGDHGVEDTFSGVKISWHK